MNGQDVGTGLNGFGGAKVSCYGLLVLIALTSLVWSLFHVGLWHAPEWGDEGHYVFVGWRIAQGERLYLDFYDGVQMHPFVYWTAAGVVKLLGRTAAVFPVMRSVTILGKLASLYIVFLLARGLASTRAGLIAAALFGFNSLVIVIGNQAMTEPYSTLFALLGLWLFCKSKGWLHAGAAKPANGGPQIAPAQLWGYFGAGLSIGLGMLCRPTPLFLGLVIGIAELGRRAGWREKLRVVGPFAGGAAAGLMPLVLYLAVQGGFEHFYLMVVRFMLKYPPTPHPLKLRLRYLATSFFWPGACRWLVSLALIAAFFHTLRRKTVPWLVVGGWFALEMILMGVTLRGVEWHYL